MQVGASGLGKTCFIRNLQDVTKPESGLDEVPVVQRHINPTLDSFCNDPQASCTSITIREGSCSYCYRFQVRMLLLTELYNPTSVHFGMQAVIAPIRVALWATSRPSNAISVLTTWLYSILHSRRSGRVSSTCAGVDATYDCIAYSLLCVAASNSLCEMYQGGMHH